METLCFVQRVMIAIHLLLLSKAQGAQNIKSEIDHNSEASGRGGGDVRLGCVYKGSATVSQILWARETKKMLVMLAIRQNDSTEFVYEAQFKRRLTFVGYGIKDGSIIIGNLRTSDSGTYICKFITTSGIKEVKINLIVRGAMSNKWEIEHDSEVSSQSAEIRLRCVYTGSATVLQMLWAKEKNEVPVNVAFFMENTRRVLDDELKGRLTFVGHGSNDGSITIGELRSSDSGNYICRFLTTSGQKEVKINVIVLGGGECDGGGCDGGVNPWVKAIATIVPLMVLVVAVRAVYNFWFRKKGSPVTQTGQGEHPQQNAPRGTQQQQRQNNRTSRPQTTELQLDHAPYGSGTKTFAYYNTLQELSSHRNRMQHLDERIMNSSETSPPNQEVRRHYEPLKPPVENAYDKINHFTNTNA